MSKTLLDLEYGVDAVIMKISKCDPIIRQRLQDMGIGRGKKIRVIRSAPLGDPLEVNVMGYNLAIRKREAALLQVEEVANDC